MPGWLKMFVFMPACVMLVLVIVSLGIVFATGTEVNNLPLAIGLFSAAYLGLPLFLCLLDGNLRLAGYLKMLGYATALFVFSGLMIVVMELLSGI